MVINVTKTFEYSYELSMKNMTFDTFCAIYKPVGIAKLVDDTVLYAVLYDKEYYEEFQYIKQVCKAIHKCENNEFVL